MSVEQIRFEPPNPAELVRWAAAEVQDELREEVLGATSSAATCETCKLRGHQSQGVGGCQGHFGYLRLAAPLFHHGYLNRVCAVLKCVDEGGALSLKMRTTARHAKRRMAPVLETEPLEDEAQEGEYIRRRLRRLPAGVRLDAAVAFSTGQLSAKTKGCKLVRDREHEVTGAEAHATLSRISTEDAELLGFQDSRPEWLVLTVLPIPPPQMRPAATLTGEQAQDELTKRIQDVIRANTKARTGERAASDVAALQVALISYLDHDKRPALGGRPQRGARPLMSLATRIKGKEGRFRGTLMGKRTDFSGRSVITGDPHLHLDEVGVPPQVAQVLTVPEVVGAHNLARLAAELEADLARGSKVRRYVWRDGERFHAQYMRREGGALLRVGDTMERPLRDGDPVVFNRQPTLSKGSLLGFRARIMPHATFRMSLAVTPSFNADFDGDEMNLFVPQTMEAAAEAATIMNAANNIVSAQGHHPQFAIVQDGLLGAYALTRPDTLLSRAEATSLVMALDIYELPAPGADGRWTGMQLASLAFPSELDFLRSSEAGEVRVTRGQLSGTLTKKVLGTGGGGLIHTVWKRFGGAAAARMIDALQFLAIRFLAIRGFSVGIRDTVTSADIAARIREDVANSVRLATVSQQRSLVLDSAKERVGSLARASMRADNALDWMVDAGSKGSDINISQISACLGQQRVEGKVIPETYRGRTLPHYLRGSDDALVVGRGFVASNYLDGLQPDEMFFHAAGGREGLIDTAIKVFLLPLSRALSRSHVPEPEACTQTSHTGYLQRKLVKSLESVSLAYDRTVRTATGRLVQWIYGEDGWDGHVLERVRGVVLPFDATQCAPLSHSDVPERGLQCLEDLRKRLQPVLAPTCTPTTGIERHPLWLDLQQVACARGGGGWVDAVVAQVLDSRVEIGETVGVVAAQSIAAWLTQSTLNRCGPDSPEPSPLYLTLTPTDTVCVCVCSFHSAGTSSEHVTLGVPRLTELLNATSNISTPSMTLPVTEEDSTLRWGLHAVSVGDLLEHVEMVYDEAFQLDTEHDMNAPIDDAKDAAGDSIMEDVFGSDDDDDSAAAPEADPGVERGPWVLRLVLAETQLHHVQDLMELHDALLASPELAKFVKALRKVAAEATWVPGPLRSLCERTKTKHTDVAPWVIYLSSSGSVVHMRGLRGMDRDVLWAAASSVRTTRLRGVPGVAACHQVATHAGPMLQTEGSNLAHALALRCLYPDHWCRLVSNDVQEVLRSLGVEAARASLLLECGKVLECDGNYVSARHLLLLVDMMTLDGQVASIGRTGVVKGITHPLGAATFEESADILYKAAGCRDTDSLQGPSQRIVFGMQGLYGTGAVQLQIDTEAMLAGPTPAPATQMPAHQPGSAPNPKPQAPRVQPVITATTATTATSELMRTVVRERGTEWAPASPVTFPEGDTWAPASPLLLGV